ncbi:DEAD/DEAH box helicase [Alkalibacterium pelagium]|uniref:ATP-dependent helicase Lhr and Lhr-like helicase n=1 Tax=Alkalibacterium pelagium TaxID=426702 RepID=A0A1H7JWF4_9LACT|nr:DEAD/DEAH box helicase [Alkalibacterium pelagium]GEN50524.1 ATP-dependent helicase [Alkalibacterium pelagium]SEK78832.1 ATP-dependent helicase Lhr and Lhr-like helicase [Alkalibacterium pelagium]
MKWDSFTPIQDMAIPAIINTDKDIILSSGTASGKTEAAFLPILSLIEKNAEHNLKVIYISPLKALINNQFDRIETLCEHTYIEIHKWHGDISQAKKNKFLKNPAGILQITPESLESLFVNKTEQLSHIFHDLDFIIIDEIHSFIDSERGIHLRSLLSRMEDYTAKRPRIIGLSATISNFTLVKSWVNPKNIDNVEIINSLGSDKNLRYSLMHFDKTDFIKLPLDLLKDLRELTRHHKSLIFCNSRGQVEETTVMLNKLANKENLGETYYAHHSSIDKNEREYVERNMANASLPKSVVATSSLELGIDIGSIDMVIQIDSTFTVSALKQRLGRSGRKSASSQILQLYTTDSNSLLQSLAVMELVKEKWVEPATGYPLPLDILFHQIISMCKETNGIRMNNLIERIKRNSIFYSMDEDKILHLIESMVDNDFLELIKGPNELIVGLEAESLLRGKEFYSVFMSFDQYDVLHGVKKIGKIDKVSQLNPGDNIILAGKLWEITQIDTKKSKVYVSKAYDGKAPKYLGGNVKIHKRIGEKIMELLCSEESFSYLNDEANSLLSDKRSAYQQFSVKSNERIIWTDRDTTIFETFTGSVITKTLVWMFRYLGVDVSPPDGLGRIKMLNIPNAVEILAEIKNREWDADELLSVTLDKELFVSKFYDYLPEDMQKELHFAHEIDINGTLEYLEDHEFRSIELSS